MFKWVCYLTGLVLGGAIVFLLFSLSAKANLALSQSNEALATVNDHLPEMLGEVKKTTHTLAVLSEDVNALKQLAGLRSDARDASLVAYADAILDLLEEASSDGEARIGLKRALGSGLKSLEPVGEFVVGARREATLLVFRAKSKQEVLHRLSHNWAGNPYFLQIGGDDEPEALEDWFRQRHEESAGLPRFVP